MSYTPLLKVMRGRPAIIEVGDETRQAVDVVKGFIWDLFFGDTILLMIVYSDENIDKPKDLIAAEAADYQKKLLAMQAQQQAQPGVQLPPIPPPISVYPHREWHFKWVLVSNVISVQTDGHVRINMATRQLSRPKVDALYTDGKPHWEVLNNHISKAIVTKLAELGLKGDFDGVYRNEKNEIVPFAQAALEVVQPVSLSPIPVSPQVAQAAQPAAPQPSANVVPMHAPVATPSGVPAGV
jgi:hypothetical protein